MGVATQKIESCNESIVGREEKIVSHGEKKLRINGEKDLVVVIKTWGRIEKIMSRDKEEIEGCNDEIVNQNKTVRNRHQRYGGLR